MENEKLKVCYTLKPHYDAGLFDYSEEQQKRMSEPHEGYLLAWNQESRLGALGEQETITVGVIEDISTHQVLTIPTNRIKIIE